MRSLVPVLCVMLGSVSCADPSDRLARLPGAQTDAAEPQVAARIDSLRAAVLAHPGSASAWGKLAMNYDVHGFKREAEACYREAADLDEDEFRWNYFLGIVLQGLDVSNAVEWLEKAREIRPDYAPMLVRLGNTQLDLGRIEDARASFTAAVRSDNTVPQGYLGLIRIALAAHDNDEAASLVSAGLEANPGNRSLYGALAEVYRRRGEMELAARAQATAQTLPPPRNGRDIVYTILLEEGVSSRWYQTRGQDYLARGMTDSAISNLRRAVSVHPEANAYNDIGIALQMQGNFEEAVQQHNEALALRPDFAEALISRAAAFNRLGNLEAAVTDLNRARELDPTLPQTYLNLAQYHSAAGNDEGALAALQSAAQASVADVRISMRLAWLRATSPSATVRDGETADSLANELLGASPGNPYVLDVLAAAKAERGDFEGALETAERARGVAERAGFSDLANQISSRMDQYSRRQPVRSVSN